MPKSPLSILIYSSNTEKSQSTQMLFIEIPVFFENSRMSFQYGHPVTGFSNNVHTGRLFSSLI